MHNIIKNSDKTASLMKRASYSSLCVAVLIVTIKIISWFMTGSLSLLSSLIDSLLDIVSSLLNLLAIRYALMPADEDHRFGHGKAEDISTFAQSAFIGGSGMFIIVEGLNRFVNPVVIENEMIGIYVMIASTIIAGFLVLFQRHVVKVTGSTVIRADLFHYKTDMLINLLVVISLLLTIRFGISYLDPIFAMVISAYILKGAYKVGRDAFDNLMDKEFPDIEREKIYESILLNQNIRGVHDLRTRQSGIKPFIQFHLEIDPAVTLRSAHDISDQVEEKLLEIFPNAEIMIHLDPQDGNLNIELDKGWVVPMKNHKQ